MLINNCEFAEDVLYDLTHDVWVKPRGDTITVGLNPYMAWLAGRVTTVRFKPVGSHVERGSVMGSYEGPKYFGVVRSPVDGEIVKANQTLTSNPRLLQNDPYREGWFAEIMPTKPKSYAEYLVGLEKAKTHFEKRVSELRAHCYKAVPDHEIFAFGVECSAVLAQLNEYLEKAPLGTVVHVASDEPTADIEIVRWAKQTGQQLLEKRVEGGAHHYLVKKVV
ncbi:MAG: sulfurtransferase TusA family protein [Thermoprotei archaeon]